MIHGAPKEGKSVGMAALKLPVSSLAALLEALMVAQALDGIGDVGGEADQDHRHLVVEVGVAGLAQAERHRGGQRAGPGSTP